MSGLVSHAERELHRAKLFDKDSDYSGMIGEAVMKLVRAHAAEGHSGMSHQLTMEVFNRVINFQPLTPLTSDPSEWNDVSAMSGGSMWQNNRQPSVFSKDGGKTWYDLDAPAASEKVQ